MSNITLTFYQIISLIGFPSLFTIIGWLISRFKREQAKMTALEKGVQAMLRGQMVSEYNVWHEDKGYAPLYVKENFENMWKQYETLGENGVIQGLHDDFMALPINNTTGGKCDD